MPERHGSSLGRSPLGTGTRPTRSHGAADRAAVREAHVKRNKTDAADAEVTYEAGARPSIRFVPKDGEAAWCSCLVFLPRIGSASARAGITSQASLVIRACRRNAFQQSPLPMTAPGEFPPAEALEKAHGPFRCRREIPSGTGSSRRSLERRRFDWKVEAELNSGSATHRGRRSLRTDRASRACTARGL